MRDFTVHGSRKRTLVAELDQNELAVRLMEAAIEKTRPAGLSAEEVLQLTNTDNLASEAVTVARRQARIALEYFRECLQAARRVQ